MSPALDPWPYGADAPRVAAQVADLARALARTTPPPRTRPYFDLDCLEPLPVPLLERLTAAGIFRKYELVLDLATGLGAAARWLGRSRGCRVVGIARTAPQAAASAALSTRADLGDQIEVVAAEPARLPVRAEAFTHAWSIDGWRAGDDWAATLAETFRVLRDGGLFAGQETLAPAAADRIVGTPPSDESPEAPSRITAGDYAASLERVGFVNVRVEDVSDLLPEPQLVYENARAALVARIAEEASSACAYLAAMRGRATVAEARRRRVLRLYHFLATKPSHRRVPSGRR